PTAVAARGHGAPRPDPPSPAYPSSAGGPEAEPVLVPPPEADGWRLRPDRARGRLGPRTRAVFVNSPANPTGTVMPSESLQHVAELAESAPGDAWVVSGEIYHGLSYGVPDHTILEFTARAVVPNGFSKAFAMTGWRLGYLIAPKRHLRTLQTLHQNFFISSNEFVQWAGVAALREAWPEVARFRTLFDERRRVMVDGLRRVGLGVGPEPAGALLVLADARPYTRRSYEVALEILRETHVAVTPGGDFRPGGEGY